MDQKLFAFWKYDLFPFVLGAEIIEMLPSGKVKVKGYDGFIFNPIKILPVREGKKVHGRIQELEQQYKKDLKKLKKDHCFRVENLIPEAFK